MPKDGSKTRSKILENATELVLSSGFAGTSIDQILQKTEITKGAFFYHFKSKSELALGMMELFIRQDMASLEAALEHSKSSSNQPREQLFQFVQFFIDSFAELEQPYEGCLYASYVYEPEQFNQEIKTLMYDALIMWRKQIGELIEEASTASIPTIPIDKDSLADHFSVILEGAFITSKALNDASLTARHLRHYRTYLELIFGSTK